MNEKLRLSLRILLYREGKWWFAHCLEMDLVAEGQQEEQALGDVLELCEAQLRAAVEDGDLNAVFRPAPAEYWRLFSLGNDYPPPASADWNGAAMEFEARELALA